MSILIVSTLCIGAIYLLIGYVIEKKFVAWHFIEESDTHTRLIWPWYLIVGLGLLVIGIIGAVDTIIQGKRKEIR